MRLASRFVNLRPRPVFLVALALAALHTDAANGALTRISHDPYTNSSSQHATEVEPDTFAFGSTIVATYQVGRFFDGGASNVGYADSSDGGTTWHNWFLVGNTIYQGGSYPRV